jgi:hypothetical protein
LAFSLRQIAQYLGERCMVFKIDIVLSIEGRHVRETRGMKVRRKVDIPYWAKKWIREMKRNYGNERIDIVSVVLNGEEDLTETVMKLFI